MHDPGIIQRITQKVIGLPTLPTVVSKLLELVDNPKVSAITLARLIENDQTLTGRILKIANSAYYGYSRQITTVHRAVVVMGQAAVREMGFSLSVFDMFRKSKSVPHFDIEQFWQHSIGVGIAARVVSRRVYPGLTEEAYIAGLLHDIGKIVINQYFPAEFQTVISTVHQQQKDLESVEMEVLGAHHGMIGGWLADSWKLPVIIAESIRYHHSPTDAKSDPLLTAVVCAADYLCHVAGVGASGRALPVTYNETTSTIFESYGQNLVSQDLELMRDQFLLELNTAAALNPIVFDSTSDRL